MMLKWLIAAILLSSSFKTIAQIDAPATKGRKIFTYVEQMPVPGYDVQKYIDSNLRYPEAARERNVEGKVFVRFLVDDDGSIRDITVARGIEPGCDKEAVRLISGMRKWKPGKQNGKAVPVYFTYPVIFKLK